MDLTNEQWNRLKERKVVAQNHTSSYSLVQFLRVKFVYLFCLLDKTKIEKTNLIKQE
jgi:hypothetical protein